jgi:hypothetical protein
MVEYVIATRLAEFLCIFIEPIASRLRAHPSLHESFAAHLAQVSAPLSPSGDALGTRRNPS